MMDLMASSGFVRTLPYRCCPAKIWPFAFQTRRYAFSRFPSAKPVGTARNRSKIPRTPAVPRESTPSVEQSQLWQTSTENMPTEPRELLKQLLLGNDTLIVERQLEMLNVFIGYEQCNKYVINNEAGATLGYITEEPGSIFANFGRQLFGTHRPFRALIMNPDGMPLLWLRRPFAFINSRMYVQRAEESTAAISEIESALETFGEVQQVWHIVRRKYDLFMRDNKQSAPVLSSPSEPQPMPPPSVFKQLAFVDAPFLAWDFPLQDADGHEIALISRSFRGLGREVFTDTGMYAVRFGPPSSTDEDGVVVRPDSGLNNLTLDERALTLALAVNIDFDYFSRHSHSGMGVFGLFHSTID